MYFSSLLRLCLFHIISLSCLWREHPLRHCWLSLEVGSNTRVKIAVGALVLCNIHHSEVILQTGC